MTFVSICQNLNLSEESRPPASLKKSKWRFKFYVVWALPPDRSLKHFTVAICCCTFLCFWWNKYEMNSLFLGHLLHSWLQFLKHTHITCFKVSMDVVRNSLKNIIVVVAHFPQVETHKFGHCWTKVNNGYCFQSIFHEISVRRNVQ